MPHFGVNCRFNKQGGVYPSRGRSRYMLRRGETTMKATLFTNLGLILLLVAAVFPATASAQTFSVLYSFKGTPDGNRAVSGLILDEKGTLYGTTVRGGTGPCHRG